MFLDVYNAMSDAENGFDSGALDRLAGVNNYDFDDTDEYGLDIDDVYSEDELRACGLLKPEDDDDY
ncbi:MAG: hypothetical protein J6N45_09650 [Alphaproteobacteria bacterium]|nr:hypothetical protein [Alphaproteobacteria bacterium]